MIRSFLMIAVFCAAFLPASMATALESGMVWDAGRRCFRRASDEGGGCGLTFHVDTRTYGGVSVAAPAVVQAPAPDVGGRLDAQMASEEEQLEKLRKNENVEKVRAIAADAKTP